jgi:GPH family glycoside/pentoside/hexuronide:cation symporter
MPLARRVAYALGNAGFMIPDRIVLTVAFYYYLPPAGRGLEPQLPDGMFLGVLTAWGFARLLGGAVDSLADPIVGFLSDRSRSRLGRRRSFMLAGLAPMALAPVALFWPPGEPGSRANLVALAAWLALFYVAFTVYVGPYLALIPELARDTRARLDLTTLMAVASAPALLLFQPLWLGGLEWGRALGLSSENALRAVVLGLSVLGLLLCALPILAVDERRFALPLPSALPLRRAVGETLRSRAFLVYLAAQICFILGVTMLQPAIPYYGVVVLGRDEGFAAILSLAVTPFAVAGFLALRRLGPRAGPRRSIMACVGTLTVALGALGLLRPDAPGGPHDARNLVLIFSALGLAGFAVAGFMVLPHVLLGQVIDADAERTGANRAAMFYGVQGLATKWVYQASLALMSWLLVRHGASAEQPQGVLSIGPVAAALCLLSLALWALYPERVGGAGVPAGDGELCHPRAGSEPGAP